MPNLTICPLTHTHARAHTGYETKKYHLLIYRAHTHTHTHWTSTKKIILFTHPPTHTHTHTHAHTGHKKYLQKHTHTHTQSIKLLWMQTHHNHCKTLCTYTVTLSKKTNQHGKQPTVIIINEVI
jgi:hypothetical protein